MLIGKVFYLAPELITVTIVLISIEKIQRQCSIIIWLQHAYHCWNQRNMSNSN